MDIWTIDFETYYSKDFSLSKLTTEQYVRSPEFEVIGVGIKCNGYPTDWLDNEKKIRKVFSKIDWSDKAILAHNCMFDASILSWHYGVKPKLWLDTLGMARAIHGPDAPASLAKLAERYGIGKKGDEIVNALGKRRKDFAAEEIERYGQYCINDVDLTWQLFQKLGEAGFTNKTEFKIIDMFIRMFTEPLLQVDAGYLTDYLKTVSEEKQQSLRTVLHLLGADVTDEEGVKSVLMSNPQFAQALEALGVDPPTKVNAKGSITYAFAKTDEEFKALEEHDDPRVQAVVAARLGAKSTILETRVNTFLDIASRGPMPVPNKYYAAHTGRGGGMDKVNFYNLPSRDKHMALMKRGLMAPYGYVMIDCDSSQIEARGVAWLAGQDDLVEAFARGEDVYCQMATSIYGREITKADELERFVGKQVILSSGYGSGAEKHRKSVKTQGVTLTAEEAARNINTYRTVYPQIPKLWRRAGEALEAMYNDQYMEIGPGGVLKIEGRKGVRLPNGLYVQYPGLDKVFDEEKQKWQFQYRGRQGMTKIYGAKAVENWCQALARIIVLDQAVKIRKRYPVVLHVYDANAIVVPKNEAREAVEYVKQCMRHVPAWAAGWPIACEAEIGYNYGELMSEAKFFS